MTKLEEVGTLIENLNFEEKAQLLTELLLQMNVSALGIRHTAGVCGGRACIRDTRIPVWSVIEAHQSGATDVEILRAFPSLTAEDLTNAFRYYRGHVEEIEADLLEQEIED